MLQYLFLQHRLSVFDKGIKCNALLLTRQVGGASANCEAGEYCKRKNGNVWIYSSASVGANKRVRMRRLHQGWMMSKMRMSVGIPSQSICR